MLIFINIKYLKIFKTTQKDSFQKTASDILQDQKMLHIKINNHFYLDVLDIMDTKTLKI